MKKTQSQIQLEALKAKYDNNISKLLMPYYSFRLFVLFTKPFYVMEGPRKGLPMKTIHRYGFENTCSYSQCLHGHVKEIVLDKRTGWQMCIALAEMDYKGLFRLARIYTRSELPGGSFDVLLREYNHKGEIVKNEIDLWEQLIKPDQNRTLYFKVDPMEFLEIQEEPIAII